jgi:hypothetical protein
MPLIYAEDDPIDARIKRGELVPKSEYPNYNPNDTLAQIIVDAWRDPGYATRLQNNADAELRARGLFFDRPRVMTHTDFKNNRIPNNTVVLVLPDAPPNLPALGNLLDSARAAMAYTPVGI